MRISLYRPLNNLRHTHTGLYILPSPKKQPPLPSSLIPHPFLRRSSISGGVASVNCFTNTSEFTYTERFPVSNWWRCIRISCKSQRREAASTSHLIRASGKDLTTRRGSRPSLTSTATPLKALTISPLSVRLSTPPPRSLSPPSPPTPSPLESSMKLGFTRIYYKKFHKESVHHCHVTQLTGPVQDTYLCSPEQSNSPELHSPVNPQKTKNKRKKTLPCQHGHLSNTWQNKMRVHRLNPRITMNRNKSESREHL